MMTVYFTIFAANEPVVALLNAGFFRSQPHVANCHSGPRSTPSREQALRDDELRPESMFLLKTIDSRLRENDRFRATTEKPYA